MVINKNIPNNNLDILVSKRFVPCLCNYSNKNSPTLACLVGIISKETIA